MKTILVSYHQAGVSNQRLKKSDFQKSDELLCLIISLNAGHQHNNNRQLPMLKVCNEWQGVK